MKKMAYKPCVDAINDWFKKDYERNFSNDDTLEIYHTYHPKSAFIKTLPLNSRILDIGAGDGSLDIFRKWLKPSRPDLKIYAYSLEKGDNFDNYDGYEMADWEKQKPIFSNTKFDAIYCANFIEHIKSQSAFFKWINALLNDEGKIYLETSSDYSLFCPTLPELHTHGFARIIGNFYDDPTHKISPSTKFINKQFRKNRFAVTAQGIIKMPFLENELLMHYKETGDIVSLQFAYWLYTGWVQYFVANKASRHPSFNQTLSKLSMRMKRPPSHENFGIADI